jgi:hypothetical protein
MKRLLLVAAAAAGWTRQKKPIPNLGVVLRPREGVTSRPATLRRLRGEGVARVKLETYGAREVREAVANLGVGSRVAVSIPDAEVEDVSRGGAAADRVCAAIKSVHEHVDGVLVGVTPPSGAGADLKRLAQIANASRSVSKACSNVNASVPVTTAFDLNVLRSSYPPSASLFAAPGPLREVLDHLRSTKAPFAIQLDPYGAWRSEYYDVSLDFATFALDPSRDRPQFIDEGSGAQYYALIDAMLDSVRWALAKEGFGDLDVVITRVGWPSGLVDTVNPPPAADAPGAGATLELAASFAHGLGKRRGVLGASAPELQKNVNQGYVVAYVYEADDGAPAPDGLRWGVCGQQGSLKYSIRTGAVVAPRLRTASTACLGPACIRKRFSHAKQHDVEMAALGVAVGALILGVAAFVAILSIQPAQARSPRSPTQVERIMRVANQRAEENQRAARAAPSLLKPQDLLRWGSRPLMTVAESPGASDVEGSEAGSLKKR